MRLYQPLSVPHQRCHALLPGHQYLPAAQLCQAPRLQRVSRADYVIPPAAAQSQAATDEPTTGPPIDSTGVDAVAAAGTNVGVDAVLHVQLQMQQQMQQQMAQMTAMLQSAQQQNALLWEQMQQMQQQLQATQATSGNTSGNTAEAAAAAMPLLTVPQTSAAVAAGTRHLPINGTSNASLDATPAAAAAGGGVGTMPAATTQHMPEEPAAAPAAAVAASAAVKRRSKASGAGDLKGAAAEATSAVRKAARTLKAAAAAARTRNAQDTASTSTAQSSSSSDAALTMKQQLEQLQNMNEVMAKVLRQKQQEQQQQQQQQLQRQPSTVVEAPAAAAAAAHVQAATEQPQEANIALQAAAAAASPPAAAVITEQQPQQQGRQLHRPTLGVAISRETAAAAAAALQELKQAQAKQAAGSPAAAAAAVQQSASVPTAAKDGAAGERRDVLLTRIHNSRSTRELQRLFERNQQRLRAHHLAAILAGLPGTVEGRMAIQELATAEAAAASSSSLSKGSTAVRAFADDLITMLQLQLGQLRAEQLLDVVQAAAALQLAPRPAWLSSFQAASQNKLQHLNPTQLAGMAAAVAAAAATASQPAAAKDAAKHAAVQLSPAWLKAWMGCTKQHLEQLTVQIQQVQQQQLPQQQQEAVATEQMPSSTAAAAAAALQQSGSAAIGKLAVAAVQLKTLAIVLPMGSTDASQPGSTKASGFVTQNDRLEFAAALVTAAAAAAKPAERGLPAAAAADIAYALTELSTKQPGLVMQLHQVADTLNVSEVMAAVAAAAAGSMHGSSSAVLMQLVRGVLAAAAQPEAAWLAELAAALSAQLSSLAPADSLTVLTAISSWYNAPQQLRQQQQGVDFQLQQLLGALLVQTAAASATLEPQQITEVLVVLGLQMGFTVTDPAHSAAVAQLLAELSHAHKVTVLNNTQLVQLLQALSGLGVAPEAGFIAVVQRDGVKPRVMGGLKPQEFADVAQALAGLRVQLEYDVLDGYWTELEGNFKLLTDADCVALLCALGALQQKPRAQLLGGFLAALLPRLPGLTRSQLCDSLQALAQLRLSKVDTQGVRVTTARLAPAPEDFISELLKHLSPQLSGPEGATAAELASVLKAVAALNFRPDQAWLTRALAGAVQKLRDAVSAPGGEQTLVNMLHALSQLTVKAPSDVLAEALHQLQTISDRLTAVQISAAMAALKTLDMDPDDQLLRSYLDRAAAAAATGAATAQDMAAVLQSLSTADVVPSSDWLQQYFGSVRQKLTESDSDTLATIVHAAASLTMAGSSSSSSYHIDSALVSELVSVSNTRLGSSYMDASRILSTPSFKAPFTLSSLSDCCWGLVKLGAQPKDLQGIINLLISKSYDRFTQLNVQQLSEAAWAIACCSSSRRGSGAIKLPTKWLNQFAAAAAPQVQQLTKPQLSELIWALGQLYLDTDSQYWTGSSSDSSSSCSSVGTGSSIARSSEVPVQQLLRAVASQVDSALAAEQQDSTAAAASFPASSDISILVNLLTKFDCSASRHLLQRFCAGVADQWDQLSNVSVADAAVAIAVLAGPGSSGIIPAGWLDALAQQVHNRLQSLPPQLLCRCIWALATLHHPLDRQWLSSFAASTFTQQQVAQLQPGDFSDAMWALFTLEKLAAAQHQQQQRTTADSTTAAAAAADSASSSSLLSEPLLQLLAKKLDKRVNELRPAQILRLLLLAEGALAMLPSYRLPKGVSDGLSSMLSARAGLVAESTGVVGLLWAAARLGLRLHITTLDTFCKKLYVQLPSMAPSDMARGFWASEKLGYRWLPPQLEEFDRQASMKLPNMNSSDVALLLAAYKAFGHAPSKDWLRKFAEMPASSLLQLSCDEAVQLAVQLADVQVGLPAGSITWLPGWAESLTAQQLQDMTGQQLFSIVKLLADASSTAGSTPTGNTTGITPTGSTTNYRPSEQLLALLSWAALPHIATANAEQVYCLLHGLGSWQVVPPNGDVLLSTVAARLAEKLPVLSQHQAVQVLCAFANLGFTVGEPLQSKLCSKVMQENKNFSSSSSSSSNSVTDAAAAAELLSAVLTAIDNPKPELYQTLMQQLDGGFDYLAPRTLLKLGQAMAAAGMQWEPTTAAVAAVIPAWFGQQYITAVVRAARTGGFPLSELATLCTAMQQTALCRKNDLSAADSLTQALLPHLSAALSSSNTDADRSAALVEVAEVVRYITDCGYSPAAAVEPIQELLLLVLRDGSSSRSIDELSTVVTAAGGVVLDTKQQQQQQQQHRLFDAATLAKLLLAMNTWGKRLQGSSAAAAFDWSRYRLAGASIAVLGPLLLGLASVCGKPPASWLLDWSAVVLPHLDQAGPEDLTAIGASLAQVGSPNDLSSSTWMLRYSQAVQQQLAELSELQLESVMYSLYCLKFRPSRDWVTAVLQHLERMAPATDTPAARALAYVRQLKVA